MYSTGRELTFRDRIEVDEIVERVKENGYGFRDLLAEVLPARYFKVVKPFASLQGSSIE